ncbi:unnamed protein product [Arabidopsis halleri]
MIHLPRPRSLFKNNNDPYINRLQIILFIIVVYLCQCGPHGLMLEIKYLAQLHCPILDF